MRIFTPCNKVKLENVSVVQMKKAGQRFELACHTNKLYDHQNGLIANSEDLLQIKNVFKNVSKGLLASKEDLAAAFGSGTLEEIIQEIILRGTLQLTQKERTERLEKMHKDISFLISGLCLNPETGLPHSQRAVEKAIREEQISINITKSTKQQALKIIRIFEVKKTFPVCRRKTVLCLEVPKEFRRFIDEKLLGFDVFDQNLADGKAFFSILCEAGQAEKTKNTVLSAIGGKCSAVFSDI